MVAVTVLFTGCLCGVIAASPGINSADGVAVACLAAYLWAVWPYLTRRP